MIYLGLKPGNDCFCWNGSVFVRCVKSVKLNTFVIFGFGWEFRYFLAFSRLAVIESSVFNLYFAWRNLHLEV